MKIIAGLGNPGRQYEKTRHNLGFMVLEKFLKDFEPVAKTEWENSQKFKSDIVHLEWQRQSNQKSKIKNQKLDERANLEKVILVKPKTYMNNSGMAVELLASYYKVLPSDIWIVHDDIDLSLGSMKIRFGGASAGHHGIDSIIKSLNTDKFWRFRMGIGDSAGIKKNTEDFVLGKFRGQERSKTRELIKRGSKAIQAALEEGLETAMNRFNTK